jgi:DNA-binding transcriptional regulator YhcF (GntR family)
LLTLDPRSKLPPFEQVRRGYISLIAAGALRTDERLPTVRQLAGELGLASNTVAKAYRELEMAGFIETRGRNGTFVAAKTTQRRERAVRLTRSFIERMRGLDIGDAEILAVVRREVEADQSKRDIVDR